MEVAYHIDLEPGKVPASAHRIYTLCHISKTSRSAVTNRMVTPLSWRIVWPSLFPILLSARPQVAETDVYPVRAPGNLVWRLLLFFGEHRAADVFFLRGMAVTHGETAWGEAQVSTLPCCVGDKLIAAGGAAERQGKFGDNICDRSHNEFEQGLVVTKDTWLEHQRIVGVLKDMRPDLIGSFLLSLSEGIPAQNKIEDLKKRRLVEHLSEWDVSAISNGLLRIDLKCALLEKSEKHCQKLNEVASSFWALRHMVAQLCKLKLTTPRPVSNAKY